MSSKVADIGCTWLHDLLLKFDLKTALFFVLMEIRFLPMNIQSLEVDFLCKWFKVFIYIYHPFIPFCLDIKY